ncbi:MAG: IS630 family transposase [bacterium]|nr:IS630 family transposase [bacterium]
MFCTVTAGEKFSHAPAIPKQTKRFKPLLKNWPDIVAQAYEKAREVGLPLRIFFQDEARFGRINDPRRCWTRAGVRPVVGKQIVREYTYAYGAFCPQDGASSHLILPAMDGYCMTYFLRHVRKEFPDDFILMVMDGAPCHKDGAMDMPENMIIQRLPPYSPELNPSENMWDDMREKFFGNTVFDSMKAVENRLCEAMNHYADTPETVLSITSFPWTNSSIEC